MRRLAIDPHAPSSDAIREAASVIASHGVVAFPTDTLYGLAADPYDARAVAQLLGIKGRPEGQAIALVAADLEQVEARLGRLPDPARRLAARFWPGPLTLLLNARSAGAGPVGERSTPADPNSEWLAPGIAAADGTVGMRVPAHAVARALCRECGRPLTATSANLSGEPASADPDVVAKNLAELIDLLLDAGPTPGGPPSTIVDATGAALRLVRAGAIDWDTIQTCVSRE
jgi:L-threonylcarbamoyladenylate synthase